MALAQSTLAQICVEKKRLNRSVNITITESNNKRRKVNGDVTVTENDKSTLLNTSDISVFPKHTINNNLEIYAADLEQSDEEIDNLEQSIGSKLFGSFNENKKNSVI